MRSTGVLPSRHSTRPSVVGDDHDVLGDVRDRQQPLAQHRQDMPQRRTSRGAARTSSRDSSPARKSWSGSTPLRSMRSQDCSITGRGATGARCPESVAERTSLSTRAARAASTAASCVTSRRRVRHRVLLDGPCVLTVRLIVPPAPGGGAHPHTVANKLQPLATLVNGPAVAET